MRDSTDVLMVQSCTISPTIQNYSKTVEQMKPKVDILLFFCTFVTHCCFIYNHGIRIIQPVIPLFFYDKKQVPPHFIIDLLFGSAFCAIQTE